MIFIFIILLRMWCYVIHLHLFHIRHSAVTKISIQNQILFESPLKTLQARHKPPLWWLFTSICNVLNLYFMKEGDVQMVVLWNKGRYLKGFNCSLGTNTVVSFVRSSTGTCYKNSFFYLNPSGDKAIYTMPKKVTPCLEGIISFIVT